MYDFKKGILLTKAFFTAIMVFLCPAEREFFIVFLEIGQYGLQKWRSQKIFKFRLPQKI
jgi:hypothetical protein